VSARRPGAVRGPRRVPILVAVGAAAVGIVAASQAGQAFRPSVRASTAPVAGPTLPPANAISATWFCSEGTSVAGGRADETVVAANLGARSLPATVSVLPGDRSPVSQQYSIPAAGQQVVSVSALHRAPEPGVSVETLGGSSVVEHELTHGSQTAVGPCARQAAPDWYFSGGDTGVGASDWLTLFNPFGDDAIVDITFLTSQGVEAPGSAQAVDVPRRARITLPLHQIVPDHDNLALHVHARTGRVVAEQSVVFDGSNGVTGIAPSLGATGTASLWRVPTGDAQPGTVASVVIANFADTGTRADVAVTLDNATAPVQHVTVPSMGVTAVPLTNVGTTGGYAVTVRTPRARPVVTQLLESWAPPSPVAGAAATLGATTTATRWGFAAGRVAAAGDAQIVALNPGRHPVTVRLLAGAGGTFGTVATARVAPGKRAVFPLLSAGVGPDEPLEVRASGPVVAGRLVLGPSPSSSLGVPARP
jgi:Family of unknown function (DUF5719)